VALERRYFSINLPDGKRELTATRRPDRH